MTKLILIFLGSGIGGVLRWMLRSTVLHHTGNWRFPLPTFIVNVAGCLAAGVVAGLIIKHDMFSANMRLFLLTGPPARFFTCRRRPKPSKTWVLYAMNGKTVLRQYTRLRQSFWRTQFLSTFWAYR
jgi:hypothetical protein